MKLIAVYLSEDIDPVDHSNTGNTAMFYVNPECQEDLTYCDISEGNAEDGSPLKYIVESFFNFGLPANEVNAALNAQERAVDVGSYKYVRLEFCKYNHQDTANIQWGTESTGVIEMTQNGCSVNSQEMDPPLELTAGDSAIITLQYDIESSIQVGSDATGDHCSGEGDELACFTMPEFIPVVTKTAAEAAPTNSEE